MHYLVKYLGKIDDTARFGGRMWGGWYKVPQEIRIGASFETRQAYVEFIRRIRRWGRSSEYLSSLANVTGLRLFGDGGHLLRSIARGIEGCTVFEV